MEKKEEDINFGIKRITSKDKEETEKKKELYYYENYMETENWIKKNYYQNRLVFFSKKYIEPEFRNEFVEIQQKNKSRLVYSACVCSLNSGISYALFQKTLKNKIYIFSLGVYFFTFALNMKKTILLTNDFSKKMINSGFLENFNKNKIN